MVDPIHIGLVTVPEHFSHLHTRQAKSAAPPHPAPDSGDHSTMPVIGGHKTLSSLLHLSGSSSGGGGHKSDGRAAFSPYTGSLSDAGDPRDARGAAAANAESGADASAALGIGSSITLNIRYVAKDMWRKVTFPPGVTVTQARDICMLRFNVWQQTLASSEALEPAGRGPEPDQHEQSPPGPGGARRGTAGTISPTRGATAGFAGSSGTGSGGPQGPSELRELYGLFWTSAGHWLESDEMLSVYPLRKGEVLELQHIVDFIPLLPHEFRFSYAEGYLYHLRPGGGSGASWQLCWAVLRGGVLRIHQQKGQQESDVELDLAQPFRLSDQDGRSWPRAASKSGSAETAGVQAFIESLPGDPAGATPGGGGGALIIHMLAGSVGATSLQQADARHVHAFRTCNIFDYDTWHRTLRHVASSAGGGGGSSISGSVSISGASNVSIGGVPPMDAAADPPATPGDGTAGIGLAVALSPQLGRRARPPSTRHEGYVNRKQPNSYGFRRRYCVLLPTALYGFLHADDCAGVAEADLLSACEFAVALDPAHTTIEAISWNGRYLLRVFGPDSMSLRDKPGATALQQSESARIQCTDILATAAQAAIEQYGSTFGMLPDARELVRLMIEDADEGQTWAVSFNSVAGLQITGQAKVIIGARRNAPLGESKSHVDLKAAVTAAASSSEYHLAAVGRPAAATLDDRDERAPPAGKQQSLSEFMVSQMGAGPGQAAHYQSPLPLPPHQPPLPPLQHQKAGGRRPSNRGPADDDAKAAPKWIPLSIDKYIKEDEERRRGPAGPANDSMAMLHMDDDADDADHMAHNGRPLHQGHGPDYAARPPARFNWFKRRGSTSR
ncbi:hypothetical protein IWQ57_001209 [Coemansia nantahalensis]|uniref:Uncharacterized protein n=1 Tax=Coemansia nantahalensis TaxID=2789366 RepID=A0ACC1K5F0_9FUNG|nr:hypothetical protein IWQ57_001209 [Coemansia nantahalensis]